MKKTDLTLFICAILFCSPAFSMDIEEKNSSSALKIKSSNKQAKSSTKNTLGWYSSNNRIKIKYTETKEIGTFGGCKLYGYIDPSLIDPRWQIAFSKGFAKTKDGTNGVKFLNNRVFELKIDADERLYTNEIHKNTQDDYLVIFKDEARHKKMKKITYSRKKKKLKIYTDCSSRPNKNKHNDRGNYQLPN